MAGYLLDTNHLGWAVKRQSPVRFRIRAARQKGIRIGTCVPVLCELEVGIQKVREPAVYRQALYHLLHEIRIWPLDQGIAREYGEIFHELRQKGRVLSLSQVDIMLAAMARQKKLTILTTDRDLEALSDIPTEDWTKEATQRRV